LLQAEPELEQGLLARLAEPWSVPQMESVLTGFAATDEASLMHALRYLRKQVMARLITRDLNGLADLAEVMVTATALAEVTTRHALPLLHSWLATKHGEPIGTDSGQAQQLIVVAMGKLGGGELNVSSDIDLIFLYPEAGETTGPNVIDNHEFFIRLGRKLIAALGERTADGFVFRVDMRLRPYGESGPLASSFAMLEDYLVTQGREWERYAWLKGRVISGGDEAELMQLVRPFVFRKYLDFGAFASMRGLHSQIRQEVQRREMQDNIKLGPGGIREIEFIAQVFQLIRGGKLPVLQTRSTVRALDLLRERHLLPPQAVEELHAAYTFLRNLEHRLQYLDDAQTQTLPINDKDRQIIAESMGFADFAALLQVLDEHRNGVTRHFEQVFATPQDQQAHPLAPLWRGNLDDENAIQILAENGFRDPGAAWQRLLQTRQSARYTQLPESSRVRFDALIAPLVEVAGGFANADQILQRILQLLESIGRRESYLALLLEYPQTLAQVANICSASPWAASYLAQHPILLDELLDSRTLYAQPDWTQLRGQLQQQLAEFATDTERQMDILRHFKHAQVFQLLAQDLAGRMPLETLSDHLSALADLILQQVLDLCWDKLRQKHRDIPKFAVIGYGKLGGKELGYASDLDIIFLYDDDAPEAAENYARLAQRINTWLTTLTSAGQLYDTDLRLRPDGASGLLVSTIEAFETYQKNQAWVWEHQALTRARRVAGDSDIGRQFEQIREDILRQPRDPASLREEVAAMRQKMLDAHPNASGLFDLKHDRGGIIDVEFAVQYLVLAHAHVHPELTHNIGNLALLQLAGEIGLISPTLAASVREAYREYRRLQHQLRLQVEEYARVTPSTIAAHSANVLELWCSVFGTADGV
jgi:glutamate-ammonia-ligase adenylyltransferase